MNYSAWHRFILYGLRQIDVKSPVTREETLIYAVSPSMPSLI